MSRLLRLLLVMPVLLGSTCLHAATDNWLAGLYNQQLALYRMAGTFYLTTTEDADREHLDTLPVRIADYRKALADTRAAADGNNARARQVTAIDAAWKPVEALVTRDIQQLIGTERRKYINNGAFNAFQRATDLNNAMPALEAALAAAIGKANGDRKEAMLRGAVGAESLATHYARLSTGYFDEQRPQAGMPSLTQAVQAFNTALAGGRQQVDRTNPLQRMAIDRIEARWRFVQPALSADAGKRPRVVYRYLGEISENFLKLANPVGLD